MASPKYCTRRETVVFCRNVRSLLVLPLTIAQHLFQNPWATCAHGQSTGKVINLRASQRRGMMTRSIMPVSMCAATCYHHLADLQAHIILRATVSLSRRVSPSLAARVLSRNGRRLAGSGRPQCHVQDIFSNFSDPSVRCVGSEKRLITQVLSNRFQGQTLSWFSLRCTSSCTWGVNTIIRRPVPHLQ